MKLFANRLTQRVGKRPPMLKAIIDGISAYARQLSPSYHRQSLSLPCQDSVGSSVPSLFRFDCPTAILRRVALGVVDAVNRMLRGGTSAHIAEKNRKVIFPLLAHKNFSAAVTVVATIVLVVAALNHLLPNEIFRALTHPMFDTEKLAGVVPNAPAASAVSRKQMVGSDDRGVPTRAAAQPGKFFKFSSDWIERRELSELLVGEIKSTHAAIIDQQKETSPEFNRRKLT